MELSRRVQEIVGEEDKLREPEEIDR